MHSLIGESNMSAIVNKEELGVFKRLTGCSGYGRLV